MKNKLSDFNDLHCTEGLQELRSQLEQYKPIHPSQIIKTQHSGFHEEKFIKGKLILTPCYEDLLNYFEQQTKYQLLDDSGHCFTFDGKKYNEYKQIKYFAHSHFKPMATNHMADEFKGLVLRSKYTPVEWWDDSTRLKMNFQNGVLDLKTKKLLSHSIEYGFRQLLDYAYDPSATCPKFEEFLDQILKNDKELKTLVCEFLGYAMSNDDYWEHKALILEGEGENGKSTLMNVIKALAGKSSYSALSLTDLRVAEKRQILDGKLFNMAEETPYKALMESSIFKNLTGGGETTVRQLYKNAYTLRNRAKLIFACNELPESIDNTHGFLRRFVIIPFKEKFTNAKGNKDPFIEEKLMKELPGIFNLIMHSYAEMKLRKRFTQSKSSEAQLYAYKETLDPTLVWLRENVTAYPLGNGHDEKFSRVKEIYAAYNGDMDAGNFEPQNAHSFGKKLSLHVGDDYLKRIIKKKFSGKVEKVLMAVTKESGETF